MEERWKTLLSQYKICLGVGLLVTLFSAFLSDLFCAMAQPATVNPTGIFIPLLTAGAVVSLISGYGLVRALERAPGLPEKEQEQPARGEDQE